MEEMDLSVVLLVLGLSWIALSFLWSTRLNQAAPRLPPGPFCYPIVGALFSLKQPLHQHLTNIGKKYGPLIYLKIGMAPFLVVNNSAMATEILKTHDLEFSFRSTEEYFRLMGHDFNDMGTSPVNENWKRMRRICSLHLLGSAMLNANARYRESEMKETLKSIFQQSGTEMNLQIVVSQLFSNSLCRVLFSETNTKVVDLVQEILGLSLNLNIGALIPALDRFDLHGIYKRMRKLMAVLTSELESQLEKHRLRKEQAGDQFVSRDFTDVLISLSEEEYLSDISKMALLTDIVLGGLDGMISTVQWTMAELILQPKIMGKAQEEIDKTVGRSRMVQEADVPSLPYIDAILKESLRLHPTGPLGAPHRNAKPVKLGDYTIPANCKVLINIWAIGRDPARWPDPQKFQPERFLGSNIPFNGQNLDYIPFSSGRRACPGYSFAMRAMSYVVASLLQAFDWKCGKIGINMEESTSSLALGMTSDLIVVAAPRVDKSVI